MKIVFAALCLASLFLLNGVDHFAFRVLPWPWVAEVRLPSLLVCLTLCIATGSGPALRLGRMTRGAWVAALSWSAGAAVSFALGARFTRFHGNDLVAFLGTGLLAEELLFRGAILGLGLRLLGSRRLGPLSRATLLSAALFSLAHLQYHDWHASPAALAQLAITFPMGLVLGYLREETESLWLPVAVHLLNNLLSQAF